MDRYEPLVSLGLALAIGILIGFEREQSGGARDLEAERPRGDASTKPFFGGSRTFPLVSLLGALSAVLARSLGVVVVLASLAAIAAPVTLGYAADLRDGKNRGLTSETALLLTFVLGAIAASDVITPLRWRVVALASVAVVVTLLLSLKPTFHSLLRRVSKDDVLATLKFLLVAVVVLPLLPDASYGPLDAFNPAKIGLFVALVAGLSFVGYVAIRLLGARRGLGLTGLVGGLASSTAVTFTFSRRARDAEGLEVSCALAVVLACTVMFPRVLVLVAVVNRELLAPLVVPMAAMTAAGGVASALLYRRSRAREAGTEVELENPFELREALKLAAAFALVLFASKAIMTYLGTGASWLAGVVGGIADVDAITISMAKLAQGGLSPWLATTTIVVGAATNTIVKAGLALAIGGIAFGKRVALSLAAVLAAGALGVLSLWLWR